ncbi:MAG: biotin/lipoyl-containing protein [Blastocatellia bacterium]
MRYEVEIENRNLTVELEQIDGRIQARVGARSYDLQLVRPEPGVYELLDGDKVYEARVWSLDQNFSRVDIAGHLFTTRTIDRKHRRLATEHGAEGRQNLLAPMPGKVVRVLVAAGDKISKGQGVVVVEAMKMQNEIKSPKSGRVVEIRVTGGAIVNANQILAVVE